MSLFAEEPSLLLLLVPVYRAPAVTRGWVSVDNWWVNTLLRLNVRARQVVTQAGCCAAFEEKAKKDKD